MAFTNPNTHRYLMVVLGLGSLPVLGCAGPPAPPVAIEHSGRSLLVDRDEEEQGFGLYSYLLFGSPPPRESESPPSEESRSEVCPPAEESRARYVAALQAYVDVVQPIEDVLRYREPATVNITYLPVKSMVPEAVQESPAALLDNYNYVRAELILDALAAEDDLRDGPYILSYDQPLTDQSELTERYLFQDLSSVPPRLIRVWVKEFVNQVEQPEYWDRRFWPTFRLYLRQGLANLAEFQCFLPKEAADALSSQVFRRILGPTG